MAASAMVLPEDHTVKSDETSTPPTSIDVSAEQSAIAVSPTPNADASVKIENNVSIARELDTVEIQQEEDKQPASEGGESLNPPRKRRKLDSLSIEGRSRTASRAASPPWRAFAAEGPSSFVGDDGRRKSSRVNIVADPPITGRKRGRGRQARGIQRNGTTRTSTVKDVTQPPRNASAANGAKQLRRTTAAHTPTRPVGRPPKHAIPANNMSPERRRGRPPKAREVPESIGAADPKSAPTRRSRRSLRGSSGQADQEDLIDELLAAGDGSNLSPDSRRKLFLRFPGRLFGPYTLPLLHARQFSSVRKFQSFEEWLDRSDDVSEETALDDKREEKEKEARPLTDEEAKVEAQIRQRILDAAEPNGAIATGPAFLKIDEREEEPDRQYGHWDHVTAHAIHFKNLMERERKAHMRDAKQLAQWCLAAWRVKYGSRYDQDFNTLGAKTREQLEKEELARQRLRKRQLIRDIKDRWKLVGVEVEKLRRSRWEEEQQVRGKQALDEMLDQSTLLLQQRRPRRSSELPSEMDSYADETSEPETPGPYHDVPDEELTDEQLALKYEHLRNITSEGSSDEDTEDESNEEDDPTAFDINESEAVTVDGQDMDSHVANKDLDATDAGDMTDDTQTGASTPTEFSTPASEKPEDLADDSKLDAEALRRKYQALMSRPIEDVWAENGIVSDDDSGASSDDESDLDDEDDSELDTDSDVGDLEDEGDAPNDMLGFLPQDELRQLQQQQPSPTSSEPHADSGHGITNTEVDNRPPSPVSMGMEDRVATDEVNPRATDSENDTPVPVETIKHGSNVDLNEPSPVNQHVRAKEEPLNASTPVTPAVETPQSSGPARVPIPTLLRGTLREYQHDGLDWLANLWHTGTNGILADEMGLGKTVQTIALLAHLADNGEWGPHLVVVPTSVILNWEMEFKKFCPGFKILTYYGDQKEREAKRVGWLDDTKWNVVITSYQLILNDAQAFKRRNWHYMVLDEAHNIKNFQTKRWQTMLTFKTHSRLLLTGTPLQNSIQELWSLLYFLMPSGNDGQGGFAGLESFVNALNRPTNQILEQGKSSLDAAAQKAVKKLHEVLRPYLLRRLKADVEKQMPKKTEKIVWCRLSKRQRQLYDEFMGRSDTKQTLASGNYMSIMNCLMSLRKVCNHPDLFESRQIVTSFAIPKSVVANYEIKNLLVRKQFMQDAEDRDFTINALNLNIKSFESMSGYHLKRSQKLRAEQPLLDLVEVHTKRNDAHTKASTKLDGSVQAALAHVKAKKDDFNLSELELSLKSTQQRTAAYSHRKRTPATNKDMPLYGKGLVDRLYLDLPHRLRSEAPKRRTDVTNWYLDSSDSLRDMVPTLSETAESCKDLVRHFGCTPPRVIDEAVRELTVSRPVSSLAHSELSMNEDPFYEARAQLAIAFPDKRLLQYDCGKLQRLALLLRELQAGGHRALIFTQMTKVLDILEAFLNFHGYRYLRLDGATSIENRQLRTNQFNQDDRIMVFILSSRSGGLGLNLTGADTVIFYDLDWNPAMDKQCQDRCHRIGQTRDVTIYRLVSEYTIETNILKKSNAKRELDDVIIQEGDFTTEYLNRHLYKEVATEASEAMDRVLGQAAGLGNAFQNVEDAEDSAALATAQKEIVEEVQDDERDFQENAPVTGVATPVEKVDELAFRPGVDEDGEKRHVDDYMVEFLDWDMRHIPLMVPRKPKAGHKKNNKKARLP